MKKIALKSFGLTLLMPLFAMAQNFDYPDKFIKKGTEWLTQAISVIMILMTVWFLINVFRYVAEKDPGKLADKRKTMLNGLIGLFIAVSVWGIIKIAQNVFNTDSNTQVQIVCPPGARPVAGKCQY